MSQYEDRRQAKADRYREWADKADARGAAAGNQARTLSDFIPMGQPILVGHHSEKRHRKALERIDNGYRRAVEEGDKADRHNARAAHIENDTAIHGADPEAVTKLKEKIAEVDARRDRMKAFNVTARKGAPDYDLLNDRERENILSVAKVQAWALAKGGGFPSYVFSNLSGNLRRYKQRLTQLTEKRAYRTIEARYGGECPECLDEYDVGDRISKVAPKRWVHETCTA